MNKKINLIIIVFVVLFVSGLPAGHCFSLKKVLNNKEYEEQVKRKEEENKKLLMRLEEKVKTLKELDRKYKEIEKTLKELQNKNNSLVMEFDKLKIDRDNLLAQAKKMAVGRRDLAEKEKAYDKLLEEKNILSKENEDLAEYKKMLDAGLGKLKVHLAGLTQEKMRLEKFIVQMKAEHELEISRIKQEVNPDKDKLKKELKTFKKGNTVLKKDLRRAEKDMKVLEGAKKRFEEKSEILQSQLIDMEQKYAELKKQNRSIMRDSSEFPRKIADLARQNKRLIEQTADMHYNSGVFFVKNKEYKQAIQEFEKVLELRPTDPQSNYNLGYIYAKPLLDREKAIKYFKNYITYAPDAQDIEWVRKYIYTWQTWYGNEPFE